MQVLCVVIAARRQRENEVTEEMDVKEFTQEFSRRESTKT